MNTPSHYILNLAFLGRTIAPNANVAITLGAILPDLPIFAFYIVAKFFYKMPERQIWSQAYYEPFWQNFIALFHSFPVAAIALIICLSCGWKAGAIACASIILHSLLDFPLHHHDAHHHFFPFSDYRFISPISYWDPKHYGNIVALVELLLVVAVTPVIFGLLQSSFAKAIAIAINILYIIGYLCFYAL
jgi:hypothetical protein